MSWPDAFALVGCTVAFAFMVRWIAQSPPPTDPPPIKRTGLSSLNYPPSTWTTITKTTTTKPAKKRVRP